jgi:hypothetical protein
MGPRRSTFCIDLASGTDLAISRLRLRTGVRLELPEYSVETDHVAPKRDRLAPPHTEG